MIDLQGNPVLLGNSRRAQNQIKHACRRAAERYGFDLTPDDYQKLRERLVAQFRDQTGIVFLGGDKDGSRFAVWHGAEWIPLVYSKKHKTIVTFLPKQVLRDNKEKLPW
ncbi:hypothetical protein [Fimbriiglobus ruber]|uniref:hypothetical protein n=1 Tax=Fimbriiglobus ruber TaxID=1908690 RepID=UPI000B4AF713|nr:hypothetical protein [Fimbriiglobus ruber]